MWRLITVILVGLTLGGCAPLVYSTHPLFSHADTVGAPIWRPGIWIMEDAADHCRSLPHKPLGRLKKCTGWFLVRADDIASFDSDGAWTTMPYLVASGAPIVLQFGPDPDQQYLYLGLRSLLRDEDGRVIRLAAWYAQCGPPNPNREPRDAKGELKPIPLDPLPQLEPATLAPLPGLVLNESGQDCWASDAAAARQAVAYAAEHPDWGMGFTAHWVREIRPDDFARP